MRFSPLASPTKAVFSHSFAVNGFDPVDDDVVDDAVVVALDDWCIRDEGVGGAGVDVWTWTVSCAEGEKRRFLRGLEDD